jgi:hypothetical protein
MSNSLTYVTKWEVCGLVWRLTPEQTNIEAEDEKPARPERYRLVIGSTGKYACV